MTYVAVTQNNPFALSSKQHLFIMLLVANIRNGSPIRPKDCIKQIYSVKTDATARVIASKNLTRVNIQQALRHELTKPDSVDIISKIVQVLSEGLEAETGTGEKDHGIRLRYIQEIHKIAGMYNANC